MSFKIIKFDLRVFGKPSHAGGGGNRKNKPPTVETVVLNFDLTANSAPFGQNQTFTFEVQARFPVKAAL